MEIPSRESIIVLKISSIHLSEVREMDFFNYTSFKCKYFIENELNFSFYYRNQIVTLNFPGSHILFNRIHEKKEFL